MHGGKTALSHWYEHRSRSIYTRSLTKVQAQVVSGFKIMISHKYALEITSIGVEGQWRVSTTLQWHADVLKSGTAHKACWMVHLRLR